ncbi:MAG: DUF86 domain-containing protein [Phycisphaerae bacterium]|nr:DUF86 domain-containing protein [Phycisphaerae bacterium]
MPPEDRIRLRHMLDAARDAISFAQGHTRKDLDTDRQLVMAVVKCVEIIGEAAGQVSSESQAKIPSLPWRDIIDMRHRLVHAYYDINLDIVWSTIQNDLPFLLNTLQTIVK